MGVKPEEAAQPCDPRPQSRFHGWITPVLRNAHAEIADHLRDAGRGDDVVDVHLLIEGEGWVLNDYRLADFAAVDEGYVYGDEGSALMAAINIMFYR